MSKTLTTPIQAAPSVRDPLRNFKFRVDFLSHEDVHVAPALAEMGFISVSGMGMQTDMIPFREGGDNTSMRKLPGQTDFGPLTLVSGVFMHPFNGGVEWMKQIYSVLWGAGNAAFDENFRCNVRISVLKHPVTQFTSGAAGDPDSLSSNGMSLLFYNCWPGSLQFNDLNAGDNSIMITNMVLHHEGFIPYFGINSQAGAGIPGGAP